MNECTVRALEMKYVTIQYNIDMKTIIRVESVVLDADSYAQDRVDGFWIRGNDLEMTFL